MINASTSLARPAPYLFDRPPRSPAARHAAEFAWRLYPPIALVLAALLLAAGCKSDSGGDEAPAAVTGNADESATNASAKVTHGGYPIETPLVGTADARATANYGRNRLEIANLSDQAWPATTVWVNHRYGALLPHTHPGELRSIHFTYLRDEQGRPFPSDNMAMQIQTVELVTGDERTTVPFGLGY